MRTLLLLAWVTTASAGPGTEPTAETSTDSLERLPGGASNPDAGSTAPPDGADELIDAASMEPGILVVDCHVPAEILVDGVKLAQLYFPGTAEFQIRPGAHLLRVYTKGEPHDFPVELSPDQPLQALVGRTGISVERIVSDDPGDAVATVVPVEIRVVGGVGAQVRLGGDRHLVGAGETLRLDLDSGDHPISVRSSDGTVIWATGHLAVRGERPVLIQVAEGRLPEVSGLGSFMASGGG